jgi:hypothetical protein
VRFMTLSLRVQDGLATSAQPNRGGGGVHCQVIRDFPGPGHWSLKIDGQSGVQGADPKGGGGFSWVRTKAEQGRAREEFDKE